LRRKIPEFACRLNFPKDIFPLKKRPKMKFYSLVPSRLIVKFFPMTTYPLAEFAPSTLLLIGSVKKGMLTSTPLENGAMETNAHSLTNISHELRNPLKQISAPLEFLKNSDGSLSESGRKQL